MMENKLSIGFRWVNIRQMQFSMFPNTEAETTNQEIKQNIGFAFGAEGSKRLIACSCTHSLLVGKAPLLHIEVVCQFQIY